MKRSGLPIVAERVFGLSGSGDDWRLTGSVVRHEYAGPVFCNPVLPYTADEWRAVEDMAGVHRGLTGMLYYPMVNDSDQAMRLVRVLGVARASQFCRDANPNHGIHAFRIGGIAGAYTDDPVRGEVELFGRVVEYERGYRAEKMRIRKLTVVGPPDRRNYEFYLRYAPGKNKAFPAEMVAASLSRRYDCEVTVAWQTSDEKSKSTKSSWMKRTLHSLGAKLQSL